MLQTDEILSTIRMLHNEHLDVRAVTLALNLNDCAAPNADTMCRKVYNKVLDRARNLVAVCNEVGEKYGIPVTNKRLAVSPAATLVAGHGYHAALQLAQALDKAAEECKVDFVGGFSALVQKGISSGAQIVIDSLPEVLSQTKRICSSINVASRKAGINVNAIEQLGRVILEIAAKTKDRQGFGAAKLVVFANIPEDNPFMAGAYMGAGEPEAAINIGVSGPGVVNSALQRRIASAEQNGKILTLGDLAEEIKLTSFRVTRVGELIGREVAKKLNTEFGIVDLSLAPTPTVGDSVGEILKTLGIAQIGAPGSTAAVAMLNDAVKKGGLFASSSVGGLSGAFIPVSEDSCLADAVQQGHLSIEKLEAMTAVCSVGLDMILIPGATPADTISALIADEMAIGVINNKTTATRLVPVPGAKAGDVVSFGGLFGASPVLEVRNVGASSKFVRFGGRIPAPLQSLGN
ncbi:MAG: PFL family protein [Planctomycetaceae bacterium]|nr:PFL family protein [Planctomycetaceae bacterium]